MTDYFPKTEVPPVNDTPAEDTVLAAITALNTGEVPAKTAGGSVQAATLANVPDSTAGDGRKAVTTAEKTAVATMTAAGTTGTGAFVRAESPAITGTQTVAAMRVGGAAASATSAIATNINATLASPAAGSAWDGTKVEASTLTVTMGAGSVTIDALKANNRYGPTILTAGGAGALTVTDAYTDYVGAPPVAGAGAGTTTITNAWSFGAAGPMNLRYAVDNGSQVTMLLSTVVDTSGSGRTGYIRITSGAKGSRGGTIMFGETGGSFSGESGIGFYLNELRFSLSGAFPITFYTNGAERIRFGGVGNIMLGCTAAGTNAAKTLVLSNSATSPSDSADIVHVYALDIAAGRATLAIWSEEAPAADVGLASTHSYIKFINGVKYKEMLVAV